MPSYTRVNDLHLGGSKHINKIHKHSLLAINCKNNWPRRIQVYKWLQIPSPINSKLQARLHGWAEGQCLGSPVWLSGSTTFYLRDFPWVSVCCLHQRFIREETCHLESVPLWAYSQKKGQEPVQSVGLGERNHTEFTGGMAATREGYSRALFTECTVGGGGAVLSKVEPPTPTCKRKLKPKGHVERFSHRHSPQRSTALQNNNHLQKRCILDTMANICSGYDNAVKNPLCFTHWSALWIRKWGLGVKRSHTDLTLSSGKASGLRKTKQNNQYLDSGNHSFRERERAEAPRCPLAGTAESLPKC